MQGFDPDQREPMSMPAISQRAAQNPAEVLVLGCRGMLGSACMSVFGTGTTGWDLDDLNIAEEGPTLARVAELQPRLIVNCAAATNVDRCETDHEYADRANCAGPGNVAKAAARIGARLIHISTDFVFDGTKPGPYTEEDPVGPINHYGRSKLAGEIVTFAELPGALIVRTAWLYGSGNADFPAKVRLWAAGRDEIRVANDQFGSPTFADDLAKAIHALAGTEASGVFHLGGAGCVSRYEWALEVVALCGLPTRVTAASASEFPLPAPRPANTCLDCSKAAALGVALPPWREGLSRHLSRT